MRTTLTLDKDVAARLGQATRRRRQPLKQVVNAALRVGLAALEESEAQRQPFRTTPLDLGASLIGSLDDVAGVLARVEGESHR